jgi:hypothetical protein
MASACSVTPTIQNVRKVIGREIPDTALSATGRV